MGFDYEDPVAAERRRRWVVAMQEAMAEASWAPRSSPKLTPHSLAIESALLDAMDIRLAAYYKERAEDAERAEARAKVWGKVAAILLLIAALAVGWFADWQFRVRDGVGPEPKRMTPEEMEPARIPSHQGRPGTWLDTLRRA